MFDIPEAVTAGSNLIGKIIDKIAPDADEAMKEKMALAMQELQGQNAQMLAQLQVDNTEASNPHWFVAGWRPFIGWVGGLGIAYQVLLSPLFNGVLLMLGKSGAFPVVDTNLLQTIVGGMLGLGLARSFEKVKGVASTGISK